MVLTSVRNKRFGGTKIGACNQRAPAPLGASFSAEMSRLQPSKDEEKLVVVAREVADLLAGSRLSR